MNRLANLFALSSLAVLLVSLSGAPTTALAADSHHVIRNIHRSHGSVAKRRRSTNHTGKKARRCRPRPSVPGGDNTSPAPGSPNVVAPAPSPPSGDYTPPAGDYTPPAGDYTPPAGDYTPPAGDYTPPAGNSPAPTPGSPTPPGDSPTSSSSADQQAPTQDAPATTSNTPTTAAPTPTGGQASGGSWSGAGFAKGGVAWPMGNNPGITRIKTNKMGWYYTWSPWCVDGADAAGFTCIRMLWGWKQVEEFKAQVPSNGDGKWLLFINEPNQHDQSNTSPESAAQLWRQEFGWRKNQGYRLISAATTSAPDGIQWMRDFFATCPDCRAQTDAIAVHYYDVSIEDFKRYVTSWREFGLPIFVTEYACQNFNGGPQCSMGDIYNFMGETMKWMDQQDWIYGYAYFGWMYDMYNVNYDNRLLGDGDWPTDLGWYSIN